MESSVSSTASVAAVIVNYRRYDLLKRCIESLLTSSRPPDQIIVVDNATEGDRLARIAATFPTIRVIGNDDNRGYAVACNQGWRAADAEQVLFLNADITLPPECLARCLDEFLSQPDVAVLTCRLLRPDGRFDHACHRGTPTPFASLAYALRLHRAFPRSLRLARYTMSWLDPRGTHDIEACSGAFMLVRRADLEAVAGWDERYWFYAEDLDLCLRLRRRGQRVRYLGTTTAIHVKGASSNLRAASRHLPPEERLHKRRVQRAIVDSHHLYFREHFQRTTPLPLSFAIRGMFAMQRLRVALATRLDALLLA